MSNRGPDSENIPSSRRPRVRFERQHVNVVELLNSKMGCDQLQTDIMKFIKNNRWFNIGEALDALEEDTLLIAIFSTIYSAKPDGK